MEYATREQAQEAVGRLSNQNLMGRLIYVREVGGIAFRRRRNDIKASFRIARRSLGLSEPLAAAAAGSPVECPEAASTLVSLAALTAVPPVVRFTSQTFVLTLKIYASSFGLEILTMTFQLPFNIGWQDLKDLFRQASKQPGRNLHAVPDLPGD